VELSRKAYEPLLAFPEIAPIAKLEELEAKIAAGATRPDYPTSFDLLHQEVVTTILHRVPGLRADAVAAADLQQGIEEIQSIQDLAKSSDRLAVGWLDTAFVDAVGLALLGSPYARLRFQRLGASGKTHILALQNTGSRAMSVIPPLRILGPAMVTAAEALNLRATGFDLRARLNELGALDGLVRLEIAGFGRAIHFDLDPTPAIEATERMLIGILKERFPAFGEGSLFDFARARDVGRNEELAAKAAKGLVEADEAVETSGLALLQTVLLLSQHLSSGHLRSVAAGGGGRVRARGADAKPERIAITANPSALVEAIIFGEILTRQRGR